jgi:ferredoxin
MQILLALSIPFLLFPHIVNTRIAHAVFGVNDTYLYELVRLWPDRAVLQSLLLLLVWSHGCVGLHYWLRLSDGYQKIRPILWIAAGLVPILALAGFAKSGQLTADIMSDPVSFAQLKAASHWPNNADGGVMARMRDLTQYVFGALIAAVAGLYLIRRRVLQSRRPIAISYQDGPTVRASPRMTLLEVSRAFGIPHASFCGGRGRCMTCRVKIEKGMAELPAPNAIEMAALSALEAPQNVRLACQIRPTAPMTVTILNRPAVPGPVQTEFFEIKSFVTAHARAELGKKMADVHTSDPAEIARWFAETFGYAVTVLLPPSSRFLMLGCRVDYVDDNLAAVVAFHHDEHAISLYLVPPGDAEAFRGKRNGYSVVGWQDAEFGYVAVSDLDCAVLDELQDLVSARLTTSLFDDVRRRADVQFADLHTEVNAT